MGSRNALLPAYVLSAVALLAAALGSLVFMETATVKVSVPTSKITANRTITGGPSGRDLSTTRIQADVTDSQQGNASTVGTQATFAAGTVVFMCTSPCQGTVQLPADTIVSTTKGVHYQTQASQTIGSSTPVPVRAVMPGATGNTDSNTVTVIDVNPHNLRVTNPQPITGGVNATTTQVIKQSDIDLVRTVLSAKVAQDLDAVMKAQAGGLSYVAEAQPTLKVTTDHNVGDQAPTFTMTITGSLGAIAFSQSQADALLRASLNQKVPKGYQLTADPIQTTYQLQKSGTNGDVTLKGFATGVALPNVTADELKSRIKGMRVDAARQQLRLLAHGTTVDIIVKPAIPWLPIIQDHIALTIVLEPTPA